MFQQIAFDHSSDIHFPNFMNLYKKNVLQNHSFLVIDTTLASINSSSFRKNLFEIILRLIMKIDDKKRNEKPQYAFNRETAKNINIFIR